MKAKGKTKDISLKKSMVTATMLIIIVFIAYIILTGRKIRNDNHEYLVKDTYQTAANIEYALSEGYANIKVLSELVSEFIDSPEVDIKRFRSYIHDSVFDFIEFADKDGINHNITGGTSDASDRKYYLDAMAGNTGIEVIFDSRATHENLLIFYAPVYYENTIIGSIIGIYQATNRITQILSTDYFGEKVTSYLCTADGKVFAASETNDEIQKPNVEELLAVSESEKENISNSIKNHKEYSFYFNRRLASGYTMPILDDQWTLVQVFPAKINRRMMFEMFGLALCMVICIFIIYAFHQKAVYASNKKQNDVIGEQFTLLQSITDIYYSMHLIDMSDYSIEAYESNELMQNVVKGGNNASDMLKSIVLAAVEEEHVETALAFTDITTLRERLKGKNSIHMDVADKYVGWLRLSFITREADNDGYPTKVILTTQIVDEDKKREKELIYQANYDELTGLLNRRAYEDDILNFPDVPPEKDFVYASVDINGLKAVNDSRGHAAGDELIIGAAQCLKKTVGNYGRVYRTGGDEFASIFFADEKHLTDVIEELKQSAYNWKGTMAEELSFSVGVVTKREFANETVTEMSKIADKRMYEDKARYYSQRGIDRRGQAAAHSALCSLYTKILKINITTDSYSIVNMNMSEQTEVMGFSDKISEWLIGFAKSGQVHEEDMDEYLEKTDIGYLKQYFAAGKSSITIHYRRKYSEGFRPAFMEIIPANDYEKNNQTLFLYVRENE